MKYLNRFNEGISWNKYKEELQKFCDDYLAYLKDDGFNISVRLNANNKNIGFIYIDKDSSPFKTDNTSFKWNEVKYDFITFLNELVKKYNLLNILDVTFFYKCKHPSELYRKNFSSNKFSNDEDINKILSGNLRSSKNISEIRITFPSSQPVSWINKE